MWGTKDLKEGPVSQRQVNPDNGTTGMSLVSEEPRGTQREIGRSRKRDRIRKEEEEKKNERLKLRRSRVLKEKFSVT